MENIQEKERLGFEEGFLGIMAIFGAGIFVPLAIILMLVAVALRTVAPSGPQEKADVVAKRVAPVATLVVGAEPPPSPAGGEGVAAQGPGQAAYNKICMSCHAAGVAGAPKFGDKAAWEARLAQGMETLYSHALQGFQGKVGVMPPKGGLPTLSDEEVKQAVDYMVQSAK